MAPSIERQSANSTGTPVGPWASPVDPEDGSPWKPPIPILPFWVLMVLTFGIFRLFWVVSVARELRRHQDPSIRPWQYVVGLLVGIGSPFVAASLTEHLDRHGRGRGWSLGPPKWLIVVFAIVALAAEFGIATVVQAEPWLLIVALVVTYAVLVPLPWAMIQLRLNRLKSKMPLPERPVRRYQFWVAPVAVMIVAGFLSYKMIVGPTPGVSLDGLFSGPIKGEAVEANTPTAGETAGYRLETPSNDWVRVENGTIAEDADLELVWRNPAISVIVYALGGGWTMDEIVDFRRNEIRDRVLGLSSQERRTLLADTAVPVSHARYIGTLRDGGGRIIWWASTVVTESNAYEVLGSAMAGHAAETEVEQIIKSLRLEPELP